MTSHKNAMLPRVPCRLCTVVQVELSLVDYSLSARVYQTSMSLIGSRVADEPVAIASRMISWQVLCNWLSLCVHKEQTVAVLINLHVIAGTYPCPVFHFLFFNQDKTGKDNAVGPGLSDCPPIL